MAVVTLQPTPQETVEETSAAYNKVLRPDQQKLTVDDDVIQAIYDGETKILRRIEIFESDGYTLWNDGGNLRVIDGNVQVSQGDGSRRVLDLQLDNSNDALVHNPFNGLWYDKIIKVYRGVQYNNTRKSPRIGFITDITVEADSAFANPFAKMLQAVGYTDINYIDVNSPEQFSKYDILVGAIEDADLPGPIAGAIQAAYQFGLNVLTVTNQGTPTSIPLMTSYGTRTSPGIRDIFPVTWDTPLSKVFTTDFQSVTNTNDTFATTLRSTAQYAGYTVSTTVTRMLMLFERSRNGGRWMHFNFWLDAIGGAVSDRFKMKQILKAALVWLYNYNDTRWWETQVGEFMIESINEPRFPHQITISGRDYVKKFDLYKFPDALAWDTGANVDTIVQGIAYAVGIKKMTISSNSGNLVSKHAIESGTSATDAMNELAQSYNFEWFFDRYGYLIVREPVDPATAPQTLWLRVGQPDGNLNDFARVSDDSELYNHIVVTSEYTSGGNTTSFTVQVENTNPNSPTHKSRIGDRVKSYKTSLYKNKDNAIRWATALLKVAALEAYSVSFTSLVFPWIEVGEVVRFIDPRDSLAYPRNYLFTDAAIPLGLTGMTGTVKRVSVIDYTVTA